MRRHGAKPYRFVDGRISTGGSPRVAARVVRMPPSCSTAAYLHRSQPMFKSPSHLPQDARGRIAAALNANLADGLDLQLQIKVAHWNIKGPRFPGLHVLFDTFAAGLVVHNDTIAERA